MKTKIYILILFLILPICFAIYTDSQGRKLLIADSTDSPGSIQTAHPIR